MRNLLILLGLTIGFGVHAQEADEINRRLDILSEQIKELKTDKSISSNKTYFGGYGEAVYKNKRSEDESKHKVANANNPSADALRFILYVGHDFSEKWKLTAEIEIEHADEIYLEQGTIDYLHSDAFNFQVGTMLIPMGIINLKHEPTTFLSVNRPEIAQKILPTTWREMGMSIFGRFSNFDYRISLVNGLKASGFSSDGVRSGRQKASKAEARDLGWVGRLDYKLMSNATLGASVYYGKAGGVQTDVTHSVYDFHFDANFKGLYVRALYTALNLKNTDKLNTELGKTDDDAVGKEMAGYYFELGYNVFRNLTDWKLIPFARYEKYNTQNKVAAGFAKDPSKERTNITYGIVAKPLDNIVFKADYVKASNKAKTGVDSWNLGVGWNF